MPKMYLKKSQIPILIINVIYIIIFSFLYYRRENYEFIIYVAVLVFFLLLILFSNKKVNFSNGVLWGLTAWGIMHMSGGYFIFGDGVLYKLQLIDIWSTADFKILKFDQLVHAVGFGLSTLIAYNIIKPYLNERVNWKVLTVLLVLIGMGVGAFNEIVEFFAVLVVPETGVGGYFNTMWDTVFNTIGAIVVVIYINIKRLKNEKQIPQGN